MLNEGPARLPRDPILPPDGEDICAEALAGLLGVRKTLPPKLFYDTEGCRLFDEITRLPEYYLTRTELALLQTAAPVVACLVAPGVALVEYGASSETKAEILLDALVAPAAYVPTDIAAGALADMAARLCRRRPLLRVLPVAADFLRPLPLPAELRAMPRLGFFPGSTIGNLDPAAARHFLAGTRRRLGAGARFLVGADLRKDPAVLLPAYDDAAGVTAAFNRNVLRRLNREAEATFDLDRFVHRAVWNDAESRIEMHLVSRVAQVVQVAGRPIRFAAGESIHTENSYKYTMEAFTAMARQAGWRRQEVWTDAAGLFALHLLAA